MAGLPRGRCEQDAGSGYVALHRSGELRRRAEAARERLRDCDLCARYCHRDRFADPRGTACRTGAMAVVSSWGPHHGEEDCLRGSAGSGTVFFARCNLRCVFCQNFDISQGGDGVEVTAAALADIMLRLQDRGCHNINWVSPSHVVAQALDALDLAAQQGLRVPIVFNTGGYDSPEALALLDGVIDIYMPDMKYATADAARRFSRAADYPVVNRAAVREMWRQVGDLQIGPDGLARRGLLVRHLVLPGFVKESRQILEFLAREISPHTAVNVMGQYHPCYRADEYPPLNRPISHHEYREAVEAAEREGLRLL